MASVKLTLFNLRLMSVLLQLDMNRHILHIQQHILLIMLFLVQKQLHSFASRNLIPFADPAQYRTEWRLTSYQHQVRRNAVTILQALGDFFALTIGRSLSNLHAPI